ncbi:hypothetical protein [Microcoleus sp. B3-A4]
MSHLIYPLNFKLLAAFIQKQSRAIARDPKTLTKPDRIVVVVVAK